MNKLVPFFFRSLCTLTLSACLAPLQVCGQQIKEEEFDLNVFYDTVKIYPAMTPRTILKVGYGSFFDINADTPVDVFNPSSPGSYLIQKVGDTSETFTPERSDVAKEKDSTGQEIGVTYLSLKPQLLGLRTGDKLRVGIKYKHRLSTGQYEDRILWHSG